MFIYSSAFILSIGIFILLNRGKLTRLRSALQRNVSLMPVMAACVPTFLVAALRYDVGTDYFTTYYTGFYRILAGIGFDHFEVGYWLLNKVVQLFTNNVFVVFAITSLLFVVFSYAAIGYLSDNIVFSILLFMLSRYYFIGLNTVRQFIALAIFAYAMRFAIERKLRSYIIFACLAISFHISTIVLIPVYWLINFKVKARYVILACLITLIAGNSFVSLAYILLPSSSKYGVILSAYSIAGSLFSIGTIGINLFYLYIYYSGFVERKNDLKYRCFLWLQILATLTTMLIPSIPVIERVYWSFSFCSFISLPYMLQGIKSQAKRVLITIILICGLCFYMYYDIVILQDHEVLPYDSIIHHEPIPSIDFNFHSI